MILAVWPEHVLYVNLLGSDVLFSTLALLATWLLTLTFRRPVAAVFAAGMVLGFSHWARNTAFHDEDLRGLHTFLDDYPMAHASLVYTGARRFRDGAIEVVPLPEFLVELRDRL